MKLSENWLRTLCNPGLSTAQLAHRLTMSGIEIESIEKVAPSFDGVVVAQVLSVEKHPDADRLNLCQVDVGLSEPLQIVCGAANVSPGIRVPCARVGAALPGISISEARVRGILSYGMLCSAKELGLAAESSGLMILPEDAPIGMDFRVYQDLDDKILELKLTPNRADCLSLLGVAREISASTGAKLEFAPIAATPLSCDDRLDVAVAAPAACPLYLGRMIRGLDLSRPTPQYLVRALERSGIRCKNVVVDVTNYVLLEMGQPLHAFDAARISGKISVRYAQTGEKITLLNDAEVALADDMLVIADDKEPQALAGIMGGKNSAVGDGTRDIFLEAAFFNPEDIAGKSRVLGFGSDSSYRFERGVDFGSTHAALERATQLIIEICAGEAGPISEAAGQLPARNPIALRVERVRKVLGIDLDPKTIRNLLSRLQLQCVESIGEFLVTPPSFRFDIAVEIDLIEELARLYGYDDIPAILPPSPMALLPKAEAERPLRAVKQILVDRDYLETIGYAFVDAAWEADFCANVDPIRLMNPIAAQMNSMRSSLVGGLVDSLRFNLNRKQARVRLFESGNCFFRNGDDFVEKEKLAGLCYGGAHAEQWGAAARNVDFYDAKADVEALFHPLEIRCEKADHPALHPGRSARVFCQGMDVGFLGEMHPKWLRQYDLPMAPILFEIDALALKARNIPAMVEISRFPAVRRDIALVVDEKVESQSLLDLFKEIIPAGCGEVALFDLYRGAGMEAGKKSLAFKIVLQDSQKTLLDSEVDAIISQLVEASEKRFDSKLRI